MLVKKTIYCIQMRKNGVVKNNALIPRCKNVSFLFRKTACELKKCGEFRSHFYENAPGPQVSLTQPYTALKG